VKGDVKPNVLFLSIDALRADRVSALGYERPTTPTLERFRRDAILCREAVSPAAFTQASFACFLTSSLPLSHGGYDLGAARRPTHLFRAFHNAGYQTALLSTFPWVSRFYGYDEGIGQERMLFVLNALVGVAANTMKNTILGYLEGRISHGDALTAMSPIIEKLFDDLTLYCEARRADDPHDRRLLSRERLMLNAYDYDRVLRVIERHRATFARDPSGYIDRHFQHLPAAHEWIAEDWRYARHAGALFRFAAEQATFRILNFAAPAMARLRAHNAKRYIDAHALADTVIDAFARRDPDRPMFLWTHFVDPHVPYCAGRAPRWHRELPGYLKTLGYDPGMDPSLALLRRPQSETEWQAWSALYDAAVRYTDDQIGRIADWLRAEGLDRNTWVVICGDHGEELGEHGDISHHFRLYDHNLRVPLLFHRPGHGEQDIDALTSLLDIAPTLMELCDSRGDPAWVGQPVTDPEVGARQHMLIETLHGGNCIFEHRPVYMAVRTRRWKYMWKEYLDPTDRYSPEGHQLYDIAADPDEQDNLYRPDHPEVAGFNALIRERLAAIPEIGPERAARATSPANPAMASTG
jgi:arylsulfatase A-like enzyme